MFLDDQDPTAQPQDGGMSEEGAGEETTPETTEGGEEATV